MAKEIKVTGNKKLITKTDLKGVIHYGNKEFSNISGFYPSEYLYQPHNIVRHPDMPKAIFKKMWEFIQKGQNFVGVLKNQAKNGDYYWVVTDFEIETDTDGEISGYMATRTPVSSAAKIEAENIYSTLLDIEETDGLDASVKYLDDFLSAHDSSISGYTETFMRKKTIGEKLGL